MSEAQAPETVTETEAVDSTPRRSAFGRLIRDPQAVITATILVVIVLLGLLAPLIAQHGPNESALGSVNVDPGTPGYLLGGDQSGRDIFARLLYSINTSVLSGLIGTSVAVVVGLTFGLIGGYFGGRARFATEWLFNLIMTFPGLLLLIVLLPVTGGDFRATMLIFGFLLAPGVYRIVRNLTVGARNELYVDAARVSGLSSPRIMRRQVMPTVRGPVIISAAFLTGSAIGVQSGLAFLGLGSTEVPSFGAMISDGFRNYYVDPLQFVWPAAFLGVLTSCLVLFGNSLRDALEGARPKAQKIAAPAVQAGSRASRGEAGEALVQIEDLALSYPTPSGGVKEVLKGVSLEIRPGETLGLVGESGSGKSQTAFSVLGLLPPDAVVTSGSIRLEGRELLGLRERELIQVRGRAIAYVPQEPMSNLDPSFTIGAQLVEGIRATSGLPRAAAGKRAMELLDHVGIPDPKRVFSSYPHQISGGMAQRVLIAGAVASRPRLLIADEPTTALDVTIQAEILDLLRDLQAEMGMAILMVTHNFGVVADICDRIAVMQQGRIVETGEVEAVFRDPQHPYTRMLLDSILDESHVRTDSPVLVAPGAEGPR